MVLAWMELLQRVVVSLKPLSLISYFLGQPFPTLAFPQVFIDELLLYPQRTNPHHQTKTVKMDSPFAPSDSDSSPSALNYHLQRVDHLHHQSHHRCLDDHLS